MSPEEEERYAGPFLDIEQFMNLVGRNDGPYAK